MKNPRKPTKAQKKRISSAGLDWTTWLVINEAEEELQLYSKKSGRKRTVKL